MAILLGTLGSDTIAGTIGADLITALSGNDTIVAGTGADVIDGGSGDDVIYAAGRRAWADGAVDTVLAGFGDDHVYAAYGDILNGGLGFDTLSLDMSGAAQGVSIDFRPMTIGVDIGGGILDRITITLGEAELGDFEAVDRVIGTAFADRILTGNANDVASTLSGGGGNDYLLTGAGNDRLDGGSGVDRLFGGRGNDTYIVDDRHDLARETANGGVDRVIASASYHLRGNVENLTLVGSAVNGLGNDGQNRISGNGEANKLLGFDGRDVLNGGVGDDKLFGGHDRDLLTGGRGADTFVFRDGESAPVSTERDVIKDFSHAEGDRIALRGIDAVAGAGNDRFTFIGDDRFSGEAGELRFAQVHGSTFVFGDTDGDSQADFSIRLEGTVDLVAADFQL